MNKTRRDAGFTMIELMIVCLVIAILAAIAMPNYARSKGHVNMASCASNQRHVFEAMTLYCAEHTLADGVWVSSDLLTLGALPASLTDCPEERDASNDDYEVTVASGCVTALRCRIVPAEHVWTVGDRW